MLRSAFARVEAFRRRTGRPPRKGAVLVLAAVFMVAIMALLALAIDMGYVMTVRSELKRATDAAALAGAGVLVEGTDTAELKAYEFLVRNPVGRRNLAEEEGWEQRLAELMILARQKEEFDVEAGAWDPRTRTFVSGVDLPSTLRVTAVHSDVPLFFGKMFYGGDPAGGGGQTAPLTIRSESIARYQPRDIVLVLDFSGSMNDDSELKRIGEYGESVRERVEGNLAQIYADLGSPQYGTLPLQPEFLTVTGQPPSSPQMPQITVTFRSADVWVESTKDLSNVVLRFSDGTTQKLDGLSGTSGAFRGTGGNRNKRIDTVWVKSGPNDSGDCPGCGERFSDDYDTIKAAFGIHAVAYPYPSGSWNEYLNYVKTNSVINTAGYRKKYGFLTLINYWLEQKPAASQTPDLWKASAQPAGSLKEASVVFMDYIQEVDTEDRIALVIYNSSAGTAKLENALTLDFAAVQDTVRARQAGHYDSYTNIGAGIQFARQELDARGRLGSFKMIVLMTDGVANRPSYNPAGFVRQEAQIVKDRKWPILAISLGDGADTALMQEVADTTDGIHFNIPGGGTVTDYLNPLLTVFRAIADHRPLVLVK